MHNGETLYGWHLALVFSSIIVALPTFASFTLGGISVKRYNECTKKKSLFRKILNRISIISLIIIQIFFVLCRIFFISCILLLIFSFIIIIANNILV